MHKRGLCCHAVSVHVCVCLSVCLSRSWAVSKWIKISWKFFHSRVATPFYFFHTKQDGDIPTRTPLTGTSNSGGVGRNRDSEPICLLLMLQQVRCCQHGHGRWWNTATISQVVTLISLVVYCGYRKTSDRSPRLLLVQFTLTPGLYPGPGV